MEKVRIKKVCPICKKEFKVFPCQNNRIYCSNKCVGISNRGRLSGDKIQPNAQKLEKR